MNKHRTQMKTRRHLEHAPTLNVKKYQSFIKEDSFSHTVFFFKFFFRVITSVWHFTGGPKKRHESCTTFSNIKTHVEEKEEGK